MVPVIQKQERNSDATPSWPNSGDRVGEEPGRTPLVTGELGDILLKPLSPPASKDMMST